MQERDFKKYLAAQRHAMDKSIYLASEKARRNLRVDDNGRETQDFFLFWVDTHSAGFCKAWDDSLCKKCKHVQNCHDCLKEKCEGFETVTN